MLWWCMGWDDSYSVCYTVDMAHRQRSESDKGGESVSKKRTLKQQIRDIQRLLSKDDLPETVRLTKERILKSLEGELNDKASQKQRQKLAKKYRMVKFFDKRKVFRKISRACREYQADGLKEPERSELLEEIQQFRRELNYIVHFPPGEKYIALYPSSSPSSQSAVTKQEELLQSIAESVEKGDLSDAALQERGLSLPDDLLKFDCTKRVEKKSCDTKQLERKAPKNKKRLACEREDEDVTLAVRSARKKLKEDGFFLVDDDS